MPCIVVISVVHDVSECAKLGLSVLGDRVNGFVALRKLPDYRELCLDNNRIVIVCSNCRSACNMGYVSGGGHCMLGYLFVP